MDGVVPPTLDLNVESRPDARRTASWALPKTIFAGLLRMCRTSAGIGTVVPRYIATASTGAIIGLDVREVCAVIRRATARAGARSSPVSIRSLTDAAMVTLDSRWLEKARMRSRPSLLGWASIAVAKLSCKVRAASMNLRGTTVPANESSSVAFLSCSHDDEEWRRTGKIRPALTGSQLR